MEEPQWIDDCFRVEESAWKTWKSFDKEGKGIVTSLQKDLCIHATRFILKGRQDGFSDSTEYNGTVDGKL